MSSGCGCGGAHGAGCETEFQYAVKAVCGHIPQTDPAYFSYTAVNIHNPSKCDTVNFRWKAAEAGDLKAGIVTPFSILTLGPDQALGITNADILTLLGGPAFIDGFVVLESPEELDVIAVYSTAAGPTQARQNAFIERVPARCVPVCDDLSLNISTGVADWQTISSPETTSVVPIPVQPVTKNSLWSNPPSGSIWVSALATDGTSQAPAGSYTYQLCFYLCSGFTNASMQFQGLADDSANVYLNGIVPANLLGSLAGFSGTPSTISLKPSLLQPGQNCLQIVVKNTGPPPPNSPSPTGFAISGLFQATGGRCPCTKLPLLPAPQGGPVGPATG